MRIICIGAHPDDCEIEFGGAAYKFAASGHAVKFLSVTNGAAGHHQYQAAELVSIRKGEAEEAARRLGSGYEFLLPVARTLDASFLRELIGVSRTGSIHLVPEALPALFHSRAAIVASGTATVEAAIMGTPFVMVYRVTPLTYRLGRPRVKVPYFAMVNLIAEEEIVPELVQHKFTAENVVVELGKIIPDGELRTRMIERLAAVKARLQHGDGSGAHSSERAAEIIFKMIGVARASRQGALIRKRLE